MPLGTKPRAIAMMVEGASNRAISEALGVRADTVSDWRHEPKVAEQVEREQMTMLAAAAAKIGKGAESCVDMLLRVVNWQYDPANPDEIGPDWRARIAAAEAVLKRTALETQAIAKWEAARRKTDPTGEEQMRFNADIRALVMGEVEREIQARGLVPSGGPAADGAVVE